MKLLQKIQTVWKNEGTAELLGASFRFILLRLPYGYETLIAAREFLHPPTQSKTVSRQHETETPRDQTRLSHSDVEATSAPLKLSPVGTNPILTCRDVTDYNKCEFVADPFLLVDEEGVWHLFFEVFSGQERGAISHAKSTDHGEGWEYNEVVLEEDCHLSFPYVFEWDGDRYMIPEKGAASGQQVDLYRAREFPGDWERCQTLLRVDHRTDDTVAFRWKERWWLLVGDADEEGLYAYYSSELESGEWQSHDQNPVVSGRPAAMRPAGRPLVGENGVTLFLQDCRRQYGDNVRAFEVTSLSPSEYQDRSLLTRPILEGTGERGWNSGRMHHIDPRYVNGRWWCVVDGGIGVGRRALGDGFSIGLYTSSETVPEQNQSTQTETEQ